MTPPPPSARSHGVRTKRPGVQFFRILGYYQDDFVYRDGRWYFETIRPMVEDTEAYSVEPSKFAATGLVMADEL